MIKQYLSLTERNKDTLEFVPMKPNTNDFVLFDEPYTIRKKIPCDVSMKNIDTKLPPYSVLGDPQAIRNYWNNKNLRKRKT